MTDPRIREHDQYVEYNKLPLIELFKRRYNIAKSLIRNPNINNVINAGQALLGKYDPKDPYLLTGIAPTPTRIGRVSRVKDIISKGKELYNKLSLAERANFDIFLKNGNKTLDNLGYTEFGELQRLVGGNFKPSVIDYVPDGQRSSARVFRLSDEF